MKMSNDNDNYDLGKLLPRVQQQHEINEMVHQGAVLFATKAIRAHHKCILQLKISYQHLAGAMLRHYHRQ